MIDLIISLHRVHTLQVDALGNNNHRKANILWIELVFFCLYMLPNDVSTSLLYFFILFIYTHHSVGFQFLRLLHIFHLSEVLSASFGIQKMKFHYLFFVYESLIRLIILCMHSICVYLSSYKSVGMTIPFLENLFSSMFMIPNLSTLTNAVQSMWIYNSNFIRIHRKWSICFLLAQYLS